MSASSGQSRFCSICSHANSDHNHYTYTAGGCRKCFKICQTGSHEGLNITGNIYVLCGWCLDHPYSCAVDVTSMPHLSK
ncbi:hypothetical protein BDW68DRAFT_185413 [Aspergillus falconensis]